MFSDSGMPFCLSVYFFEEPVLTNYAVCAALFALVIFADIKKQNYTLPLSSSRIIYYTFNISNLYFDLIAQQGMINQKKKKLSKFIPGN